MFPAARKKTSKRNVNSKASILDCIFKKMKSAKLYEHLRKHNIISLPCKSTWSAICGHTKESTFGFCHEVFNQLKKKAQHLSSFELHGGLLVDEIQFSEHLHVTASRHTEGFIDMVPLTADGQDVPCDHGMVIMLVPFVGKWTQVICAFATSGNAKAEVLSCAVFHVSAGLTFLNCYKVC